MPAVLVFWCCTAGVASDTDTYYLVAARGRSPGRAHLGLCTGSRKIASKGSAGPPPRLEA